MFSYPLDSFISRHTDITKGYAARFKEVVTFLELRTITGWLAGGSCRRLIDGSRREGDYDLFFPDELTLNAKIRTLQEKRKAINVVETPLNVTIVFEGNITVQFIKLYFKTKEELLENFDFTLCQFVTDGETLWVGDYTLLDVGRKVCSAHKITYPASSIRRLIKYANQGYTVCDGAIKAIIESCKTGAVPINPQMQAAFEEHEQRRLTLMYID